MKGEYNGDKKNSSKTGKGGSKKEDGEEVRENRSARKRRKSGRATSIPAMCADWLSLLTRHAVASIHAT